MRSGTAHRPFPTIRNIQIWGCLMHFETALLSVCPASRAQGLMQEQISQQNHDDLGCDGWEISAHGGSAPDHEPFQGRQYPDKQYHKINNSLHRRIGTLNCGHSAMPIIMGVNSPQYTDEELEEFQKQNEEGVTAGDKHYTLYEATQRQRSLERSIRKRKAHILVDEELGDTEKLQQDQIRLQILKQRYHEFSKAAGLPEQYERLEKAGFTWKHGKAAERAESSLHSAKKVRPGKSERRKKLDEGIFSTYNITKADSIRPRSVMKEMRKSEIGRTLLAYLQEEKVPIRLCYGIDNPRGVCGSYDPFDDVINVYCDVTKTTKETAVTVIHEAMHKKIGSTHTLAEEVECYRAEYIHKKGQLTKEDIEFIVNHIRKHYPELR